MKSLQFKHAVMALNSLILILILVGACNVITGKIISPLKLMWSLVCVAITIFVDTCYSNVDQKVNRKRVGLIIVDLAIALSIIMLIVLGLNK